MRKLILAGLLIQVLIATSAMAQEQKVLFCAESISFTRGGGLTNEYFCSQACQRETNTNEDCLSSQLAEGWQVVTSARKEIPQRMDKPCSCVGIQYVLKKEVGSSQTPAANIALSEKEIELLKKENDLLKKENDILKRKSKK